jgi:hypothetical protein
MTKRLVFQVVIEPKTDFEKKQGQRTWLYDRELFEFSESCAQAYATKMGADYECVRDRSYRPDLGLCYQRFKFFEYASQYDEILYLDADIVVYDTAPDIFQLIKPGQLTAVQDGDWDSTTKTWTNYLKQKQNKYSSTRDYRPFCSGLLLMDRQWAEETYEAFELELGGSIKQSQGDQYLLNKMVIRQGEQYNELNSDWGRWDKKGLYMDHISAPKRRHPNYSVDKYKKVYQTRTA